MNQQTQIELLAINDRLDISNDPDTIEVECLVDNTTPESLMIIREQVDRQIGSPCWNCFLRNEDDKHILDYCHHKCNEDGIR